MPVPEGFDYDRWLGPAPWAEYHEQRCHYTFRFILDYSGGQVTNFGAHHLDLAQWALGVDHSGPVEVTGKGEFPASGLFTTATKVDFEFRYASGVRLVGRTGESGVRFLGDAGQVFVRWGKIETQPAALAETQFGKGDVRLCESNDHHADFLDCIRSRRQPICHAEIGHRSATACHLANIGMRLGRKLTWDPTAERFVNDAEANAMLSRPYRAPWALPTPGTVPCAR